MMLTSKPISEKAAKAAGLVDEVVPKDRRACVCSDSEDVSHSGRGGHLDCTAVAFG